MAAPAFSSLGKLTVYHGDALEILPTLDLSEMFCFTAPPNGLALPEIRRCKDFAIYCATLENFALAGLTQIVAVHPGLNRGGFTGFSNLLTRGRPPMFWPDVPIDFLHGASGEPGAGFAAHVLRELCTAQTVIDPYAGRGGTIQAALALGLNAVAIDIDRGLCETMRAYGANQCGNCGDRSGDKQGNVNSPFRERWSGTNSDQPGNHVQGEDPALDQRNPGAI